jgi:hypothetical protein
VRGGSQLLSENEVVPVTLGDDLPDFWTSGSLFQKNVSLSQTWYMSEYFISFQSIRLLR